MRGKGVDMSEEKKDTRKKACVVTAIEPVKYNAITGCITGKYSIEGEINKTATDEVPGWSISPGKTEITLDGVKLADFLIWSMARSAWVPIQNRMRALSFLSAKSALKDGFTLEEVISGRKTARAKSPTELAAEIGTKLASPDLTIEERMALLKQLQDLTALLQKQLDEAGETPEQTEGN